MSKTPLPKVLVSSVVRGAEQGASHGGLYLVDLDRETHEQLIDWNDGRINFEGRGADRGLRGVAIADETIYVAASDELFAFDRKFRIIGSWRNPYLKHCHEISLFRGRIYLTSTGYDSMLRFDIAKEAFDFGLQIAIAQGRWGAKAFDPNTFDGPPPSLSLHLNSVFADDFGIFVSGLRMPALLQITPSDVSVVAEIPLGTHNAQPFRGGLLLNATEDDSLVWFTRDRHVSIRVPRYPEDQLQRMDADASGIARQAFGRGLCRLSGLLVAGGSSPTTVSVYDLGRGERLKSINISMDVRNAAHGMAVWPF